MPDTILHDKDKAVRQPQYLLTCSSVTLRFCDWLKPFWSTHKTALSSHLFPQEHHHLPKVNTRPSVSPHFMKSEGKRPKGFGHTLRASPSGVQMVGLVEAVPLIQMDRNQPFLYMPLLNSHVSGLILHLYFSGLPSPFYNSNSHHLLNIPMFQTSH